MKSVTVLFAVISITGVYAWPMQQSDAQQGFIHSGGGQLLLSYELLDGTKVSEHGILKPTADGSGSVLVKKGSVQFISPEGTPFTLSYIADELGFRVQSHNLDLNLPVPIANTAHHA